MVTKDERRRQLAREKYERQQQRRAEQQKKARKRNAAVAAGLAVVLVAGGAAWASVGLTEEEKTLTDASAEASAEASASPSARLEQDPCGKPAKGKAATKTWKKEPALDVDASAKYTMELRTTCGDVSFTMDAEKAPHTVNSFAFLAGEKYFDHTKCHRLTTSGIYVLQCGDPTGSGSGGPGYNIPDENLDALGKPGGTGTVKYPAGTVAMANTGQKDSGGSQFFLVYRETELPPSYTPFGTVSKDGMKVLEKIADAGVQGGGGDGAPVATVVIDEATVKKA
ncbi:peptidylprolyl isomerase [Streptomyces sp. HB2AG]|uniref:peptidylprolyl isomerase n=1 Tax=Streptomyces sp. HB2AG TaxID=2983400 RepID=UPI0022AA1AD8|nr:peptidylprolyl isomerase [Streptomyces sp. HB2AG]MCZ2527055.1 peptidylprolyl isomerase [Streptomyces sp. HB2AG]